MSPAAVALRTDPPSSTRASVESLLRDRKLDRTLTTARPLEAAAPGVPFHVQALDHYLQGGLPAGQLSEVVGPASSGRTTLVWQWLAAATRRGETVALVDTFDRFDPASAVSCGLDLDRLLWVRGQAITKTACAVDPVWLPGVRAVEGPGTLVERTLDRALKALNLVLQSGVCQAVVLDLGDVPSATLRRIPYATWLRLQRVIEGGDTTGVIIASEPLARSAHGVTLHMQPPPPAAPAPSHPVLARAPLPADVVTTRVRWQGDAPRARRFGGLHVDVRVASSRRQVSGAVPITAEPRVDRLWAER